MEEEVRVRIAPSPTGVFHLGTARTALFNYLFAKSKGGQFIVRIEDTDRARNKPEYENDILDGLNWLGLTFDEGPVVEGPYKPYQQGKRVEIYKKYTKKLLDDKKAYPCFCSPEELEAERKTQQAAKKPPKYSGKCRNLTPEEQQALQKQGRKPAIRFKVEEINPVEFKDIIRGKVIFDPKTLGDFIIEKSDGIPTFLLAGVIDDFLMKISHVIRGEEHISNTPRQILLQRALGFSTPEYAHLPLIFNKDKSKMSKRKDPVSVTHDFKEKGYLPQALVNFLALLGWAPAGKKKDDGKMEYPEIFSLKELVEEFNLDQVQKHPAIFWRAKLDYLNSYYIRQMTVGELSKSAMPFIKNQRAIVKNKDLYLKALALVQTRLKKLDEIEEAIGFFFAQPDPPAELLVPKGAQMKQIKDILAKAKEELAEVEFINDNMERALRSLADRLKIKAHFVLWPIRVALTGKEASPGVFEILLVLGKDESLKRIELAIGKLN